MLNTLLRRAGTGGGGICYCSLEGKTSCCIVTESTSEFNPVAVRRTELTNSEAGYLAKEISKQSVEGTAGFLLLFMNNMKHTKETC